MGDFHSSTTDNTAGLKLAYNQCSIDRQTNCILELVTVNLHIARKLAFCKVMNLINFYRTRHLNAHFASLNAHFVEHKNAKATRRALKHLDHTLRCTQRYKALGQVNNGLDRG